MKRPLFAALALCGLLAACSSDIEIPEVPAEAATVNKGPTSITLTAEQERQIGMTLGTVTKRPFPVTVQSTGQVKPSYDLVAHVTTPTTGRVTAVSVLLGQPVRAGQLLARLKSDQVGQIEADLLQGALQAETDILQARVQLDFSHSAYRREQKLYDDRISSRADLEAARAQFEKDQTSYQSAGDRRQALITIAQERLSLYSVARGTAEAVVRNRRLDPYVEITAPRSGVLIARGINIGELADPSKELFTIADLSRVKLVADIYEKDIPKVRVGQSVRLTVDSLGRTFPGRIKYVASVLDPSTRTLPIFADVPNPGLALKPDMFARIEVRVGDTSTIVVPREALQRAGDYTFAYVALGGHRYEQRRVETGLDDGKFVQISRGLKPGAQVAVSGTLALQGEALKLSSGIQ